VVALILLAEFLRLWLIVSIELFNELDFVVKVQILAGRRGEEIPFCRILVSDINNLSRDQNVQNSPEWPARQEQS